MKKHENFVYKEVKSGLCIIEYIANEDEVIIPDEIKGIPVVEIVGKVFKNKKFENVVLPKNLKRIGERVFSLHYKLEKIDFPDQLEVIEEEAFSGCDLLPEIKLPDSVTSIGDKCFSGCHIENIKLSKKLLKIGKEAFMFSRFKQIELPSSLMHIGAGAFSWNTSLEIINIPSSIVSIGQGAFTRCDQLKEITSDNVKYVVDNNILYEFKETYASIFKYFGHDETKIIIPDKVQGKKIEKICDDAFMHNLSLQEVHLPAYLVEIGNGAFDYCTSLQSVHVNSQIRVIRDNAFKACYKLTSINLPDSVVELGENAFSYCFNLSSIKLPTKLRTISKGLFFNCSSLEKIVLPSSVQKIDNGAFSSCISLVDIEIPNSVIEIEEYGFEGCQLIKNVKVSQNIRKLGLTNKYYLLPSKNSNIFNKRLDYVPLNGMVFDYTYSLENSSSLPKTFDDLIESIYKIYNRVQTYRRDEKYQKSALALFMLISKDVQDHLLRDELIKETRKHLKEFVIDLIEIDSFESIGLLMEIGVINNRNYRATFSEVFETISEEKQAKIVELKKSTTEQDKKKKLSQSERDNLYKL